MAQHPLILEVQNGKYKGRKVKVQGPSMIVGRGEEAGIRISSAEVSRTHCELFPKPNGVLVRDLESRNGTFINGRPITGEKLLSPGGTLTVGPLTFLLPGPASPPLKNPRNLASTVSNAHDQKLSDDEIASWLTDEIPIEGVSADTTVIETSLPKTKAEPVRSAAIDYDSSAAIRQPRREFRSVEEEARDIIRRHHEMVEQNRIQSEN